MSDANHRSPASPPVPGRPNPEPDLPGPVPADEGEMPDEDDGGPAAQR